VGFYYTSCAKKKFLKCLLLFIEKIFLILEMLSRTMLLRAHFTFALTNRNSALMLSPLQSRDTVKLLERCNLPLGLWQC
jgi:hypothetical protein